MVKTISELRGLVARPAADELTDGREEGVARGRQEAEEEQLGEFPGERATRDSASSTAPAAARRFLAARVGVAKSSSKKGLVDPAQEMEGGRKGHQSDSSRAIGVLRRVLTRLRKVQKTQRHMISVVRTQLKGEDMRTVGDRLDKFLKEPPVEERMEAFRKDVAKTSQGAWLNTTVCLAEEATDVDYAVCSLEKAVKALDGDNKKRATHGKANKKTGKSPGKVEDGKRKAASLKKWRDALRLARAELGVVGFQAPKKGTPLHARAKQIALGMK